MVNVSAKQWFMLALMPRQEPRIKPTVHEIYDVFERKHFTWARFKTASRAKDQKN